MRRKISGLITVSLLLTVGIFGALSAQAANKDNFVIKNFDVKLNLDRDESGRSTLRTVETITADFPNTNQNHGLERVMVKEYDSHKTSFNLISVTDGNGRTLPYHWEDDALRIGDEDTYVHGLQTYQITYAQRDVTKGYQDTGKDEFYWDAIGTEWRVPIEQASVQVEIAPDLRSRIQTDLKCYVGYQGGTGVCQTDKLNGMYKFTANDLGSGRGATVALGFIPHTFIGYQKTTGERIAEMLVGWLIVSNFIFGPIALVIGGLLLVFRYRRTARRNRKAAGATVVPEYLPPKNHTFGESARVWSSDFFSAARVGQLISAQLVAWAVSHYVELRETKKKSFFHAAEYSVTFRQSFSNLPELDQRMARLIVGHMPEATEAVTTGQLKNQSKTILKQIKAIDRTITGSDLYEAAPRFQRWTDRFRTVSLIFGIIFLNVPLIILAIISSALGKQVFLSGEGERLRRYLEGLKMYIGVAEEKRLQLLQSPDGAEKVGDVTSDKGALVKLYERVLPYAIIFGQEKEWTRQLGKLYESAETSPDWIAGSNAYNAAALSGFMGGFSSSVTQASSHSSSSGGSGGGGYSGGGGGGGGGGGW
jgi:uncharacterized membrane protein YgcG